jgi:signal transduction histidine kinase
MSIRWQLSLLIGLVVAVVVTAMGAGLYVGERAHLLRKMEEGRRASLSQFFQGAADASAVRDDIALLNAAESMAQTPGVREAFLVDSTGLILAHSDVNRVGSRAKGVARGEGDWKEAGEVFFQASKTFPLLPHRTVQAVVVYSRTAIDRSVRDALRQTFRIILGVSAAVLLLGLAGASVLALSLARPIQRLTEGTQAVAQGRLDHRVGSARRDELGRLAQNFDLMAERLGELDRMKNDFVANVTHELRSPLSAIESCVNVMIDNMRAGETADNLEFLTLVRNNVARLARFINDLLDVARIEAHRLDLSLGPVRVADLAAEVAGLYREKARDIEEPYCKLQENRNL